MLEIIESSLIVCNQILREIVVKIYTKCKSDKIYFSLINIFHFIFSFQSDFFCFYFFLIFDFK